MASLSPYLMAGILLLCSGCSRSQALDQTFCNALISRTDEHQLAVDNLYVFGDYQHGVIALTKKCSAGGIRIRIVDADNQEKNSRDAEERVLAFKRALLFTPHRNGGMFKVSALVDIDAVNLQLTLRDVRRFDEIDREERERIFAHLREAGIKK